MVTGYLAECARFVETRRDCIIPSYRYVSDLYFTVKHLFDDTEMGFWAHMVEFGNAWWPIEKRWETEDFSILQPMMSDPMITTIISTLPLLIEAGQKEVEHQGTNAIKHLTTETFDAPDNHTHAGGGADAGTSET
jgi:hypothetical protein